MLAALLLAAVPSAAEAPETPRNSCAGGRFIFFEPGSDRIDPAAAERLEAFAAGSRQLNASSDIKVESGGDGFGPAFDAALSGRRSDAIRAFLLARGLARDRIRIAFREEISRDEMGEDGSLAFYGRIGWVAELVTRQEYLRHFPADLFVECF